jgi:hypothetical protein
MCNKISGVRHSSSSSGGRQPSSSNTDNRSIDLSGQATAVRGLRRDDDQGEASTVYPQMPLEVRDACSAAVSKTPARSGSAGPSVATGMATTRTGEARLMMMSPGVASPVMTGVEPGGEKRRRPALRQHQRLHWRRQASCPDSGQQRQRCREPVCHLSLVKGAPDPTVFGEWLAGSEGN